MTWWWRPRSLEVGQQICPVPSEQNKEMGLNVERKVEKCTGHRAEFFFFFKPKKKLLGSIKVSKGDNSKEDSHRELSSIKQCKSCTNWTQHIELKVTAFLLSALGPSPHRWADGCLGSAGQCSRSFCLFLQNKHEWRPHWPAGPKHPRRAPGRWRCTAAGRVTTAGWSRQSCPTGTGNEAEGGAPNTSVSQLLSLCAFVDVESILPECRHDSAAKTWRCLCGLSASSISHMSGDPTLSEPGGWTEAGIEEQEVRQLKSQSGECNHVLSMGKKNYKLQ